MSKPRQLTTTRQRAGKPTPTKGEIRRARSEARELARRFEALADGLTKLLDGRPLPLPLDACPKATSLPSVLAHVSKVWAHQRGTSTRTHDLMMLCAILERMAGRVATRTGKASEGHLDDLRGYLTSYLPGIERRLTDTLLLAFLHDVGLPVGPGASGPRKPCKQPVLWAAVSTVAKAAGFQRCAPDSLHTRFRTWRKEAPPGELLYSPPSDDADSPGEEPL